MFSVISAGLVSVEIVQSFSYTDYCSSNRLDGARTRDKMQISPSARHGAKKLISFMTLNKESGAQRLINLEIPVLVRSLKSSNVELG